MTYIDPKAKVFRHLDRVVGWQNGTNPPPVTVEWDLSNRCTLGCQDCHFAHTHVRGPWASRPRALPMAFDSTGDLADPAMVQRALKECAEAGVLSVIWTGGGEPTTHPQWQEIMGWAADAGLEQGMYTLGGLFTEASATHAASLLKWVVVSLDCPDAATYASEKGVKADRFDAAIQGVRWLARAQKATVGVSYLIHSGNWHRMREMIAVSRALGATYTMLRPSIQTSPDAPSVVTGERAWIADALPLMEALGREKDVEVDPGRFAEYMGWQGHGYAACHGPRLNTTITPDGRMWMCPQHRGVTVIGDLRIQSFSDAWAQHPGHYTVNDGCRVSCRLHALNQTLDRVGQSIRHENFM